MLSIILTILNRKKGALFLSFIAIALCNGVFFASSIHKELLLQQYASALPRYSDSDIFVVSKNTKDILHPEAFHFPHTENIVKHDDVLGVSALAMAGDCFSKTEADPQLLVISLKKDAKVQKWMDTFDTKPEFVAIHSGQYKYMYHKAIIVRNKALQAHFSLLSIISMVSFLAAGIFAAGSVVKLRKEMRILLLEGLGAGKVSFCFWFYLSKLAGIATCLVFALSLFYTNEVLTMIKLLVQTAALESLAILVSLIAVMVFSKGGYGKDRVF